MTTQRKTINDIDHLLPLWVAGDVRPADLPGPEEESAWSELVSQAGRLGMAPLLYRRLESHESRLPATASLALEQAYWSTAVDNTRRAVELQRILEALAALQIPVILLKGAVLAETVYPDIGTRSMADMDLLVPPARVEDAEQVLDDLGYRTTAVDNLGHTKQFLRTYGGELTYHSRNGQGVCLDLHWRLIHQEGFRDLLDVDHQALWLRAREVPILGEMARQLSVEDTILYLAMHLALHHRLSNFRMLFDVDRVVRAAETVDWPGLASRAATWRVRFVTYMVLEFSQELFATPVPDELLQALRPSRLRVAILKRLVDTQKITTGAVSIGSKGERLLHLALTDRVRDIFKSVFRTLWPERDWILSRYRLQSSTQVPRYRVHHVGRMARYGLLAASELLRPKISS